MKLIQQSLLLFSIGTILCFSGRVSFFYSHSQENNAITYASEAIINKADSTKAVCLSMLIESDGKPRIVPARTSETILVQNTGMINGQQHKIDSLLYTIERTLIAMDAEDSTFCNAWMPKIAFDGTEYSTDMYFRSPKAKLLDESSGTIQHLVKGFLVNLECDNASDEPVFTSINLIIDEHGQCRGLYAELKKNKKECAVHMAREVFNYVKVKAFCPAIDIETSKPIPDVIEIII